MRMALNYFTLRSNFLPFVFRHGSYRLVHSQQRTNLHFRHTLSFSIIRPLSLSNSLKFFPSGSYAKDPASKFTENDSAKDAADATQSLHDVLEILVHS